MELCGSPAGPTSPLSVELDMEHLFGCHGEWVVFFGAASTVSSVGLAGLMAWAKDLLGGSLGESPKAQRILAKEYSESKQA
jgi:hypothetical protein